MPAFVNIGDAFSILELLSTILVLFSQKQLSTTWVDTTNIDQSWNFIHPPTSKWEAASFYFIDVFTFFRSLIFFMYWSYYWLLDLSTMQLSGSSWSCASKLMYMYNKLRRDSLCCIWLVWSTQFKTPCDIYTHTQKNV